MAKETAEILREIRYLLDEAANPNDLVIVRLKSVVSEQKPSVKKPTISESIAANTKGLGELGKKIDELLDKKIDELDPTLKSRSPAKPGGAPK